MHKDTFLLICGLLVFGTPLVGVPSEWKDIALFVLGFCVVVTAFLCRLGRRRRMRKSGDIPHMEHNPGRESEQVGT